MSGGVVFFSKSLFRLPAPTETEIVVPAEVLLLDGGAPGTVDAQYGALDGGATVSGVVLRQIDGNYDGDVP